MYRWMLGRYIVSELVWLVVVLGTANSSRTLCWSSFSNARPQGKRCPGEGELFEWGKKRCVVRRSACARKRKVVLRHSQPEWGPWGARDLHRRIPPVLFRKLRRTLLDRGRRHKCLVSPSQHHTTITRYTYFKSTTVTFTAM